MRIPKKKELLRLQTKYRTDKKIGEALGGVPAHLVAYWRKKKRIPACDLPKYGLKQIKALWETWGSDKQAAAQLAITPAAFYKWRQKYRIKEKPRILRFNQLQLNLFAESKPVRSNYYQSLVEKIASLKLEQKGAMAGEKYRLEPNLVVLNSEWEKLIQACESLGVKRVKRVERVWAVLPAFGPSRDGSSELLQNIKGFLKQYQIKNQFSSREGDSLQVLWERSLVPPLGLAVGPDRSIQAAGFIGCWGQNLDPSDLAQFLEEGKFNLEVPATLQIQLQGEISPAIFASDIYSFLRRQIEPGLLQDKMIELCGPALGQLSLSQRMALALLWTQAPIRGVLLEVDQLVRKNILSRLKKSVPLTSGDEQAVYFEKLEFDLTLLEPQVSYLPPVNKVVPIRQQKKKPVHQIILGAGFHGRLEELEVAARILSGRKIHPEVQLFIVPSSRAIFLSALKKGYIRVLLEAGAIICDPGMANWENQLASSGPILTTGRLNSNHSDIFQPQEIIFANPATAAASALKGEITDPRDYL